MLLPVVLMLAHTMLSVGFGADGATLRPASRPQAPSSPQGLGPEPPLAVVSAGEPAPNFSYQGTDGHWRGLRDLTDKGAVLLAFAPREHNLIRLQREREALLDLGVIPVALVELRPGSARSLVRRLGLTYTVLSDPRCVIASQFNVVDPITQSAVPSWFIVDRRGRVRALRRGSLPVSGYPTVAARALGLPLPGATLPSHR
ncbi:MAG: redoxin domain-containing protein [Candidatus Eisenbacteria bacterium]|uniref:Redoxin domain-containing protein n=1 Tax=Eiseniibacteriota bacterium TaxID=2212470 RepID=A0A538TXZ7_UNCEI|nr:MAG: redoxin domain-containing protein [Candidatus Eisenbacteria bacterium]